MVMRVIPVVNSDISNSRTMFTLFGYHPIRPIYSNLLISAHFRLLAGDYSKEVKKHTSTGFPTIDRAIFTHTYKIMRPEAFTARNIRAGWSRAGIQPWNPSTILELPLVKNFGRSTPQLEVPSYSDGVPKTPTKIHEVEELQKRIQAKVIPRTRRHVDKLARGAVHELTAKQMLQSEVRDVRKRRVDVEIEKRAKRLKKIEEERSVALADIIEARRAAAAGEVRIIQRKRPKRLIVAIPTKKTD